MGRGRDGELNLYSPAVECQGKFRRRARYLLTLAPQRDEVPFWECLFDSTLHTRLTIKPFAPEIDAAGGIVVHGQNRIVSGL